MIAQQRNENGALVISIQESRLEARNAPDLRAFLIDRIDQGNQTLILDMTHVDFMDSSALGALIGAVKKMGPLGSIAITHVSPTIERLLKLTRMDKVFAIHKTVDDAISKSSV